MTQPHPAPFSKPIVDRLRQLLQGEEQRIRAVDPYGGTARLLEAMPPNSETTIVEIERVFVEEGMTKLVPILGTELSTANGYKGRLVNGAKYDYVCGDSALVLARRKKLYTHIITSPDYGNRMADAHNPTEGRVCRGYGQSVGGALAPMNSAQYYAWDQRYWDLHLRVMGAAIDRLDEGGKLILNVSDFYKTMKKGEAPSLVPVVHAWIAAMDSLGMVMVAAEPVGTRRFKNGANRHRAKHEMLVTFERA